jgi:UPF0042 nucleotide-binding protein
VELTVITGLSGAGKSQAMGAFEDAGWFCVDNLPPRLLPPLAELVVDAEAPVSKVAVVCDVRGGAWFAELAAVLDSLSVTGARVRTLFLEASDDVLLRRFSETRRRHPLAEGLPLPDAIERERRALAAMRARADVVIDSSHLTIWDLRRTVFEALGLGGGGPALQVDVVSFGYKHGVPHDADLVFDVRFLHNPHYVEALAPLVGTDAAVAAFVSEDPAFPEFVARLTPLLDFLLPAYRDEGKSRVVIAFGCTGGRHRSVVLAELVARRCREQGYRVSVGHRHVGRPHRPPGTPGPEGGDRTAAARAEGAS